jgi:transcriptional regulator with XRE-family HTH domain
MDKGLFLKKIRLKKKYTLAYVASKVKITASLLSQIENGKITPSMKSLEDLLKFYAINLSDFFKQVEQKRFILVRNNETETIRDEEHGYTLTLLASKLQNNALESFLVEMQADAVIEAAILSEEINGERIIYIISGKVKITVDDSDSYVLTHGDSLNFKSYVPCNIITQSDEKTIFIISGLPPIFH